MMPTDPGSWRDSLFVLERIIGNLRGKLFGWDWKGDPAGGQALQEKLDAIENLGLPEFEQAMNDPQTMAELRDWLNIPPWQSDFNIRQELSTLDSNNYKYDSVPDYRYHGQSVQMPDRPNDIWGNRYDKVGRGPNDTREFRYDIAQSFLDAGWGDSLFVPRYLREDGDTVHTDSLRGFIPRPDDTYAAIDKIATDNSGDDFRDYEAIGGASNDAMYSNPNAFVWGNQASPDYTFPISNESNRWADKYTPVQQEQIYDQDGMIPKPRGRNVGSTRDLDKYTADVQYNKGFRWELDGDGNFIALDDNDDFVLDKKGEPLIIPSTKR